MLITKRVVNALGEVLGYMVTDDRRIQEVYWTLAQCISNASFITNATLLKNGTFRGKSGVVIPRIVQKDIVELPYNIQYNGQIAATTNITQYVGSQLLNFCKQIRMYARTNSIVVDQTSHNSNNGRNTHLFALIRACGMSVEEFVQKYLANIQPCMLGLQATKNAVKGMYTIYDYSYKIKLYIKIRKDNKLVVSFHEDNVRGFSRVTVTNNSTTDYGLLLIDKKENMDVKGKANYKVTLCRGFALVNCFVYGDRIAEDTIVVSMQQLNHYINETMLMSVKYMLDELVTDRAYAVNEVRNMFGGREPMLFITSVGGNVLNMLSTLIDVYPYITDKQQRATMLASVPLVIAQEVYPTEYQHLLNVLQQRYLQYDNTVYKEICHFLGGTNGNTT